MPTINPFAPSPVPEIAKYTDGIVTNFVNGGRNFLATYQQIQAAIESNKHYTRDQIIAALGADFYAQLAQSAVLTKSLINFVTPGTIIDTVPEATITMPKSASE